MINKGLIATVLVAGALGTSGCAWMAERMGDRQSTAGQAIDDKLITSRVKERIADDRSIDAKRINIETLNGMVQLSGFVSSQTERNRAVQIAKAVPEVKAVRDDLIVRPAN